MKNKNNVRRFIVGFELKELMMFKIYEIHCIQNFNSKSSSLLRTIYVFKLPFAFLVYNNGDQKMYKKCLATLMFGYKSAYSKFKVIYKRE